VTCRLQMKAIMYRRNLLAVSAFCILSATTCWTVRPKMSSVILADGRVEAEVEAAAEMKELEAAEEAKAVQGLTTRAEQISIGTLNVLSIDKTDAGPVGHVNFGIFNILDGNGRTDRAKTKERLKKAKQEWLLNLITGRPHLGVSLLNILALHEVDEDTETVLKDPAMKDAGWLTKKLPDGQPRPYKSGSKDDFSYLLYKNKTGLFQTPHCVEVAGPQKPENWKAEDDWDAMKETLKNAGWFFACTFLKERAQKDLIVVTGHAPSSGMTPDLYRGISAAITSNPADIRIAMGDFNEPINEAAKGDADKKLQEAQQKLKEARQKVEEAQQKRIAEAEKKVKDAGKKLKAFPPGWHNMTEALPYCVPDRKEKAQPTTRATIYALRKIVQGVQNTKSFETMRPSPNCTIFEDEKDAYCSVPGAARAEECKYAYRYCLEKDRDNEKRFDIRGILRKAGIEYDDIKSVPLGSWWQRLYCSDPECNGLEDHAKQYIDSEPEKKQEDFIFSSVPLKEGAVYGCADNGQAACPGCAVKEGDPEGTCLDEGWLSDHSLVWATIDVPTQE